MYSFIALGTYCNFTPCQLYWSPPQHLAPDLTMPGPSWVSCPPCRPSFPPGSAWTTTATREPTKRRNKPKTKWDECSKRDRGRWGERRRERGGIGRESERKIDVGTMVSDEDKDEWNWEFRTRPHEVDLPAQTRLGEAKLGSWLKA